MRKDCCRNGVKASTAPRRGIVPSPSPPQPDNQGQLSGEGSFKRRRGGTGGVHVGSGNHRGPSSVPDLGPDGVATDGGRRGIFERTSHDRAVKEADCPSDKPEERERTCSRLRNRNWMGSRTHYRACDRSPNGQADRGADGVAHDRADLERTISPRLTARVDPTRSLEMRSDARCARDITCTTNFRPPAWPCWRPSV